MSTRRMLTFAAPLAAAWLTPAAAQSAPPEYNRRVEEVLIVPTPGAPGNFFDVFVEWSVGRDQSLPTALDLSAEIQAFVNGASTPAGVMMADVQFDWPYDGCGPVGCANQWGCASLSMDGTLLLGQCREFDDGHGDTLYCHCSGSTTTLVASLIPLMPGDEIMVILYPAPGALPELPGFEEDDEGVGRLELEGTRSFCAGDGSGGACPCANFGQQGQGCENSTGAGALLYAGGTVSVGDDDLLLHAQGLVPAQPALLFYGDAQLNGGDGVPFGDGLRCVGGTLVRLEVHSADAAGTATWGPGYAAQEGWLANDVLDFQVWYRDPVNSPCDSGFNLTNGLEVVLEP